MWTYLETFILVFLTDILYTYYLKAVHDNNVYWATFWCVTITFTASIAVINYTEDHYNLIASMLGAGCGTYFGMKIKKENNNESSKS